MKTFLAGAVIAASIASVVPAAAQRIDIGPGGPSVDFRSRADRERDFRRRERMREDRDYYRSSRYGDDFDRRRGRDYRY